ncbi:MAG: ROK family protein [bacterium]
MGKINIGIDIGGTDIKVGVVDSKGSILEEKIISSEVEKGVDHVLSRITKLVNTLDTSIEQNSDLGGIGLGIPGQIDFEKKILLNSPNLPAFKNINVPFRLNSYLNTPVIWDNDANLAALGEFTYGAGKEVSEMMMITLGTGIGSGLILRGEVYHGCKGFGGEFGHLIINPHGPQCNCGNHGCVEAFAGTRGIIRTFKEIIKSGTKSILKESDIEGLTPKHISNAARKGDEAAIKTFKQVGFYLGVGLAGVVNLLNLEMIVVGGGIAKAGDLILGPARKAVKEYSLKDLGESVQIVPAKLGNQAGLIGAAHLALLEFNNK